MLIPYDHRYYLSDADRDISEQSLSSPDHFRKYFRYQVDRNIQQVVNRNYTCISLLNDTTRGLEETMYRILSNTGYQYEKVIPVAPKIEDIPRIEFKLRGEDSKKHADSKTASMYIPVKKDASYMHAVVKNGEKLFSSLNEEYHADYFIFLTQFEIKTNYNKCMDIALKIYEREVIVHFSIYDKEAKVIAGSYATAVIASDKNEASLITRECFPELAKYVAGCLP
jgi:hypothetical protein